jgi:hypothetical protein
MVAAFLLLKLIEIKCRILMAIKGTFAVVLFFSMDHFEKSEWEIDEQFIAL